jgi:amino acid adenylation domain-containing protein
LSFEQERLWLVGAAGGDGLGEYNVPFGLRLSGLLDVGALRRALGVVVARHEVLRSRFVLVDGVPVQVVDGAGDVDFEVVDVGGAAGGEGLVAGLVAAESVRPFDLAGGPLLRARLYRLAAEEHVFLLTVHHIATDGWSSVVLAGELSAVYAALVGGRAPALAELPLQYRDFAAWQRERAAQGAFDRGAAFWRDALAGLPSLDLPTDRVRPAVRSGRGGQVAFEVAGEVASGLRRLAASRGATLFMVTLSVFEVLLSRYCGQRDFGVGVTFLGRTRPELESLIGFFVNTLVLRADVAADRSFVELLGQVRERALAAYEFQDVPFQRLVQEARAGRDLAAPALTQVMFQLISGLEERWSLPGLRVSQYPVPSRTTKFDLSLSLEDGSAGLTGWLGYAQDLFDADTAGRLVAHYQSLLAAVVREPDRPVGTLPMLSPAERQELMSFNPRSSVAPGSCIHWLFQEQVAHTPDAVAVECADQRMTYHQLNVRANQLAHWLAGIGVGPETRVALCLPRGVDAVIAMLAVLKAGGAYVPLDPDYPPTRQELILTSTTPVVLLTHHDTQPARRPTCPILLLDTDTTTTTLASQPHDNPATTSHPDNLAYVMHTSGSTGQPKGVMTTHDEVVSFVEALDYAGYVPARALSSIASPSFDAAVFETWSPLLTGATCVIFPGRTSELRELAATIRESGADTILMTPALFNVAVDEAPQTLAPLHRLLVGGDAVSREHVDRAMRLFPDLAMICAYGPTECSVIATCYRIPESMPNTGSAVPIGFPLRHVSVYVLDSVGGLVPVGVTGELYIGGVGVTRGYFGQPGLTADRFGPDPFGPAGGRLYRTGDLARWHRDGTLEFLGRVDRQIKVRGFRVEPGEVEAALRQQPEVSDAVVVARAEGGTARRLVAYVTWRPGQPEVSGAVLRARLQDLLPGYMIPSAVVPLAAIPLNANGKADHARLPDPGGLHDDPGEHYAPPSTPTEQAMVTIWQDILGISRIGIHDNFFDIGGDSIRAVAVVAATRSLGIGISLRDIIQAQTVAQLSELAGSRVSTDGSAQVTEPGELPVATHALVAIKRTGHKRPIFCVHPSGGTVRPYERMSRWLPLDQPLYGFQALGIVDGLDPSRSVEEAAYLYVTEMRAVQPHGPYTILSWSLGGVFAVEMARMLRQNGERIGGLVLMEPSFPDRKAFTRLRKALETYRLGGLIQDELAQSGVPPVARTRLENEFTALLNTAYFDDDDRKFGLNVPLRTQRALLEAFYRYRLGPYQGKLHLVVTEECLASSPESPSAVAGSSFADYLRAWQSVATEVVVHQSAGVHESMFHEPHVRMLAQRLVSIIDWEERQDQGYSSS